MFLVQKPTVQSKLTSQLTSPPSEDRYAALKDLDNALKTQQQYNETIQQHQQAVADWVNSSPNTFQSPQSSVSSFGSPMFDQFQQQFNQQTQQKDSPVWNPFSSTTISSTGTSPFPNNAQPWGVSPKEYNPNPFRSNGNYNLQQNGYFNRTAMPQPLFNGNQTSHNGFGDSINPFKVSFHSPSV